MPISVDSVNRILCRWARPHVGEERLKRVLPASAHGYSVRAIVLPRGIIASGLHPIPDVVLPAPGHAVRCKPLDVAVSVQTTARQLVAMPQRIGMNNDQVATNTATAPTKFFMVAYGIKRDNSQSTKLGTDRNGDAFVLGNQFFTQAPTGQRPSREHVVGVDGFLCPAITSNIRTPWCARKVA
jgi:hypothetical protein